MRILEETRKIKKKQNFTFTAFEVLLFIVVMVISILTENTSCQTSIQNQVVLKISHVNVDLIWRRSLKNQLTNVGITSRKLIETP